MELVSKLIQIGFTEYEAQVYLALLSENPATGYQISKKSGVPRSMVYEALGRLHGRGAILKTDDQRSTLYRPVSPDLLLDRLEQQHQTLIDDLRAGLRELYTAKEADRLWSISGESSILAYAARMVQSAEDEILLVLPDLQLASLQGDIAAACQRGISTSALLTGTKALDCPESMKNEQVQIARHPPLESELQQLNTMLLVVVDRNECLIADTGSLPTATITNNSKLVMIARQFVWMELFTQRIAAQLGPQLAERLKPQDRQILTLWE